MDETNRKNQNTRVIKIIDLKSNENDFKFWQTQPIEKRLETLEQLRTQYMIWKYGTEQRFQRVYRIVERSQN